MRSFDRLMVRDGLRPPHHEVERASLASLPSSSPKRRKRVIRDDGGRTLIPGDLGQGTAVSREENESPGRSKQDRDRQHQHRFYDTIPQMRRVT